MCLIAVLPRPHTHEEADSAIWSVKTLKRKLDKLDRNQGQMKTADTWDLPVQSVQCGGDASSSESATRLKCDPISAVCCLAQFHKENSLSGFHSQSFIYHCRSSVRISETRQSDMAVNKCAIHVMTAEKYASPPLAV